MKPALAAMAVALAATLISAVLYSREAKRREELERRVASLEADLVAEHSRPAESGTPVAGAKPVAGDVGAATPPSDTKSASDKRIKKLEGEVDRLEDKVRDLSRASHGAVGEEVAGLSSEKLWDKAQMAIHDHLTERSDALLREFLQRFPNDPHVAEALLALGNSELRVQDWPEAIEFYNRILAEHPDSGSVPYAEFYLGMSLVENGDLAGGREHYEKSVEKFAGNAYWQAAALINLGDGYAEKGQPEVAKEYWRKVTSQFAGNKDAAELVKAAEDKLSGAGSK